MVAEENAQAMEYVDLLTAHPTDGQESSQPQQDPTPKLGTAKQQASPPVAARVHLQYSPGPHVEYVIQNHDKSALLCMDQQGLEITGKTANSWKQLEIARTWQVLSNASGFALLCSAAVFDVWQATDKQPF